MRFEGTKKSKTDNDVDVYSIVMNRQEVHLMRALAQSALIYTPRVTETTQVCGRLRNFVRTLDKILC